MGYYVRYEGQFTFTGSPLTVNALKRLYAKGDILHSDSWVSDKSGVIRKAIRSDKFIHGIHTYSLSLNDDWDALIPNDQEIKSDYLMETIKLVLQEIRKEVPDFGLEGEMLCIGEDHEKWKIKMVNGKPVLTTLVAIEFDPENEIIVKKPFYNQLIEALIKTDIMTDVDSKIRNNTRTK